MRGSLHGELAHLYNRAIYGVDLVKRKIWTTGRGGRRKKWIGSARGVFSRETPESARSSAWHRRGDCYGFGSAIFAHNEWLQGRGKVGKLLLRVYNRAQDARTTFRARKHNCNYRVRLLHIFSNWVSSVFRTQRYTVSPRNRRFLACLSHRGALDQFVTLSLDLEF